MEQHNTEEELRQVIADMMKSMGSRSLNRIYKLVKYLYLRTKAD